MEYVRYLNLLPETINATKRYKFFAQSARNQASRIPKTRDGVVNIHRSPEGAKYLEYVRLAEAELQKLRNIDKRVSALPISVIRAENNKNYVFDGNRLVPRASVFASRNL
jgi:hypothetical protein